MVFEISIINNFLTKSMQIKNRSISECAETKIYRLRLF